MNDNNGTLVPLSHAEILTLKKKAESPNWGSKYASLIELRLVIFAYEKERNARLEAESHLANNHGFDLAQIWYELQAAKGRIKVLEGELEKRGASSACSIAGPQEEVKKGQVSLFA